LTSPTPLLQTVSSSKVAAKPFKGVFFHVFGVMLACWYCTNVATTRDLDTASKGFLGAFTPPPPPEMWGRRDGVETGVLGDDNLGVVHLAVEDPDVGADRDERVSDMVAMRCVGFE
jgi:hypothetical protein